jgi:hypothetical protein
MSKEQPINEFLSLVTCMAMFQSNYDAVKHVEFVLGTNGVLLNIFNRNRFGTFNRDVFLEKYFNDALMFSLFYPRSNSLFIEHMIGLHLDNEALLIFLAEQYQASLVWDEYFTFALDYHIITAASVKKLKARINTMVDTHLNCISRNKFFNPDFILNQSAPKLTTKIASAFLDVLPKHIKIDKVEGDGNCFFVSIQNQFEELLGNYVNHLVLREHITDYCKLHFDDFVDTVKTWQEMYGIDKKSREWSFFKIYSHLTHSREIAKKMLQDDIFLQSSFFAESFSINVIVEYINSLLSRKLMIILIDTVNEPSPVLGHTELGKENMYTFLLKEPEHYSSMEINHKRVFVRRNLPKMNFTFLQHLEE